MSFVEREGKTHRPELDGVRGLAILGVLCSHSVSLTGLFDGPHASLFEKLVKYAMTPLWGGVDLFFALSGFLITGILLKTRSKENYFLSFYARRVLRIFPIYYAVLILSVIAAHYFPAIAIQLPPTRSWKLAYFFYLQNWPPFWHGEKMMNGFWGVYWSLAVEEQFYLVWPLLVFLFSPKALARVCVVGLICALPLRIYMSAHFFGGNFGLAQITSSRVDGLLLGSACAIFMYRRKRPVPIRWIVAAICAGTAIMGYIAAFHHPELLSPSKWMLTLGITGFALLSGSLVALSQYHFPLIQLLLSQPLLRKFGKYSYGIYVYHSFLFLSLSRFVSKHRAFFTDLVLPLRLFMILLTISAVFIFAKFSYEVFESRFLRLKERFEPGSDIAISARVSAEA